MALSANNPFSVFRLAKSHYINDTTAKGSFKYGGRWNPKGYGVIYTSASKSLAFCEFLSHLNTSIFPPSLSVREIEIPRNIKIKEISVRRLPKNWTNPFSRECQEIGRQWLVEEKYGILKVPSVVIPDEFNYILNIRHDDFKKLVFHKSKKFLPDARIVKKIGPTSGSSR